MNTKKCPFCAEEINQAAIICKHCGRSLPLDSETSAARDLQGLRKIDPPSAGEDFRKVIDKAQRDEKSRAFEQAVKMNFAARTGNKALAQAILREQGRCERCLQKRPTRKVVLSQSVGAIIVRFSNEVNGNLCRSCIDEVYKEFTLTTLFGGWWSITSFIFTPFILIGNTYYFLASRSLQLDN